MDVPFMTDMLLLDDCVRIEPAGEKDEIESFMEWIEVNWLLVTKLKKSDDEDVMFEAVKAAAAEAEVLKKEERIGGWGT